MSSSNLDLTESTMSSSASFGKRRNTCLSQEIEAATVSGSMEFTKQFDPRSSVMQRADLTMNKLRFDSLGLYGRDEEIKRLLDALQRCQTAAEDGQSSSKGWRELVTIGGLSGTGKSSLAKRLMDPVARARGAFIAGKCSPSDPYSGITSACQELCHQLTQQLRLSQVARTRILQEMGTEVHLLIDMIPDLHELLEIAPETTRDETGGDDNCIVGEQAQNRFQYAFCRFFQCMTSCLQGKTLVMVLDDVHWSDQASLSLIHALLQDTENTNSLMIVATYRTDEIDELRPLTATLAQSRLIPDIHITEIQLGNLDVDHVNQMLQTVLSVDDASDLAELCLKRTMGNALFLRRFISLLEQERLLKFNFGGFDWKWDCAEIEDKTAATANVVEFLRVKMSSLERGLQRLLSLASFLEPTFDWNTINIVWHAYSKAEEQVASNSVEKWMWLAMEEALLEKDDNTGLYRWAHDKVREAAGTLVPEQDRVPTQFELGVILHRNYDNHQLNEAIFLVTNLLNAPNVNSLTKEQQYRNAQLNLRAAAKAKDLAAFESAASYVAKGLETMLLSSQNTLTQQWPNGLSQLLLDLYSTGAEAELAIGNSERATGYCQEVLKQERIGTVDKMRVYHVMLQSMGAGGDPAAAVQLAFKVLKDLGCKFPSSTTLQAFSAISSFLRATSKRHVPKQEHIETLPLMADPAKMACMTIMDKAMSWTYLTGQSFVFLLFLGRMVDWTLKYGLSDRSPAAFANVGYLACHVNGTYELGAQWSEYSLVALKRVKSNICDSRCKLARAWATSYKSSIQPLLKGYKSGMMAGDVMNAVLCLWHVIHHALLSGKPLRKVEEDCRTYSLQMQTLKQQQSVESTNMTWQAILNLMGRSQDKTTLLQGEAIDEEEFLSQEEDIVLFSMDHFKAIKSYLYCYFGEHDDGAKLAIAKGDSYQKKTPGGPIGNVECFARAISLYHVARSHRGRKRRMYRRHASAARATMATIVISGNPNVAHLMKLLDAEHASLAKKTENQALKLYEESITLAGRGGFVQDSAIANERLGEYLHWSSEGSGDEGAREDAKFRLEKAIEYYTDWGAHKKAELLRCKVLSLEK